MGKKLALTRKLFVLAGNELGFVELVELELEIFPARAALLGGLLQAL